MSASIERNTSISGKVNRIFTTYADNQLNAFIKVFERERSLAKDNHLLEEFELVGILPASRDVPQIEVTFYIDDCDGILKAVAVDKSSGNGKIITIMNKNRLSKNKIERMISEAKKIQKDNNIQREYT
jgi:molecular chaperone DnaK (HSP70)